MQSLNKFKLNIAEKYWSYGFEMTTELFVFIKICFMFFYSLGVFIKYLQWFLWREKKFVYKESLKEIFFLYFFVVEFYYIWSWDNIMFFFATEPKVIKG